MDPKTETKVSKFSTPDHEPMPFRVTKEIVVAETTLSKNGSRHPVDFAMEAIARDTRDEYPVGGTYRFPLNEDTVIVTVAVESGMAS